MWFISDAYAATVPAAPANDTFVTVIMMLGFVAVFYFLLWRPQSKRAKDHRDLVTQLAKGDEVSTQGGIVGKIADLKDDFIILTIAKDVQITVQRSAVTACFPKGTLKHLS